MADFFQIETHSGKPFTWKNNRIIPFNRSVRIRIPGLNGGLVWNRPSSVWVQTPEGEERVLPIQDVTCQVILALLSATFGVWILTKILRNRRK